MLDADSFWPKNPVIQVPANTSGRDWVVGDIHGAFDLLKRGLDVIQFDASKDRLFCLGDMVDRGPKSLEVLRLSREPWFYAERGNHEQACLDLHAEHTLANNGMHPLAVNFGATSLGQGWVRDLKGPEQVEVIHLLEELPVIFNVDTKQGVVGLVHAEVPPKCSWSALEKAVRNMPENLQVCSDAITSRKMPESMASLGLFKQKSFPGKVEGVSRVYHGHVPLRWPFRHENRYYIDTGAWQSGAKDGWSGLTIVQLDVLPENFDRMVKEKLIDGVRVISDD